MSENLRSLNTHATDMPIRLKQLVGMPGWELVTTSHAGDVVSVMNVEKARKHRPVLIEGQINSDIRSIVNLVFRDLHLQTKWAYGLADCHRLLTVDPTCDVISHVTKGFPGFMSPRDFVVLRKVEADANLENDQKGCIMAIESVTLEAFPEKKGFVRGSQGLGGWILCKGEEANTTQFQLVCDVDPKLSFNKLVPQKLLENRIISSLNSTLNEIRRILSSC